MNINTAPGQNRTKLEIYQKNCYLAIDDDGGSFGYLIISSSIPHNGYDVNIDDIQ